MVGRTSQSASPPAPLGKGSQGACDLAAALEEVLQQPGAVFAQNPGIDRRAVAVIFAEQIDHAAAGAGEGLPGAKDQGGDPGVDDGPGAHGAGLQGYIQGAAA